MATRLADALSIPAPRAIPVGRAIPVARKVERGDLKPWAIAAAGLALVALLSLLYISQASAVSTAGYDIKRLESEKKLLQAKNEQLRLQISQLKALNRVEKEAASRLGMAAPRQVVYATTPVATRTVALSSRDGARDAAAVSDATKASLSAEADWWDGVMRWFPFAQRPLTPAPRT